MIKILTILVLATITSLAACSKEVYVVVPPVAIPLNTTTIKITTMSKEIWKDVVGYEGVYKVSNLGGIRSVDRIVSTERGQRIFNSILLSQCNNGHGYNTVSLSRFGIVKKNKVHRIVACAFICNHGEKPQVNHKNGIKTDNRVENLEWVTHTENQIHSFSVLGRKGGMSGRYGKLNHSSKAVNKYTKENVFISEYESQGEASRTTGVSQALISRCCIDNSKSGGGFKWKYKNDVSTN